MKKALIIMACLLVCAGLTFGGTFAQQAAQTYSETGGSEPIRTLDVNVVEQQRRHGADGLPTQELEPYDGSRPLYPAMYVGEQTDSTWLVGDDGWFGSGIVGAQDKVVSLKNEGTLDAYVRLVFAFEDPDHSFLKNGKIRLNWNKSSGFTYTEPVAITIGGEDYTMIAAIYNTSLTAGAATQSTLRQVAMERGLTNADIRAIDGGYEVKVVSQALSTENLDTLIAQSVANGVYASELAGIQDALDTAFGKLDANTHPWH